MSIQDIFSCSNRTLQGIGEAATDTNVADISRGLRVDRAQGPIAPDRAEPSRAADGAAIQSDRRLRQLRRAGCFCADHPADIVDGGGDPDRPRLREASRSSPNFAGTDRAFWPRPRAFDNLRLSAGSVLFVLPRIYGFSTLGRVADLALFACRSCSPQVLWVRSPAVFQASRDGGFGVCCDDVAAILSRRRVLAARDEIPPTLDQLCRIFPSESAIDGLVRIGQIGARLGEVRSDWLYLWFLSRRQRASTGDRSYRCCLAPPSESIRSPP
jgi:ABC-2 type transport system permease protein